MSGRGGILAAVAASLLLGGCTMFGWRLAHISPPPPAPSPAPAEPVVAVKPPPPAIEPPPPPAKPRACVPKTFPRAPKYPDTDAALLDAGGAADRYQLMAAGRVLRSLRLAELEKIVEGCR
jgi:hypothetical protein